MTILSFAVTIPNMGMINLTNSLRYGPTGKKRKKHFVATVKTNHPKFKKATPTDLDHLRAEQEIQYKSIMEEYMKSGDYPTQQKTVDNSWKAEESKNFTVAPAYNKGAYQVIPRKEVKHIGK